MATVTIMDQGLQRQLDLITGKSSTSLWKDAIVKVFQNNYTPTKGDTTANYTEATFPGYAAITLTPGTWPSSSLAAHVASATYGATLTYTRSSTGTVQNCYGIYVTDNGGTVLLGAALFDSGPYPVTNINDAINETLTVQIQG